MTSFQTLLTSPRPVHPSRHRLDLALVGELSEADRMAVESHLSGCPLCTERAEEIRQERAAFLLLPRPKALWQGGQEASKKENDRRLFPRFFATALVSIAASILAFVGVSWHFLAPSPPSEVGFRLKSGASPFSKPLSSGVTSGGAAPQAPQTPQETPSLDVYLERQGQVTKAISGERYHTGDRLALAYKAAGIGFFALLFRDSKGDLMWLYPDKEGPSIPLAAQGRLLGSIELDHAQGTERMVAFFSPYALSVADLLRLAKEPPPPGWFRLSPRLLRHQGRHAGTWGFAWHFVLNKGS